MDKKESPVVVAQIMGKWVGGGVESVIMNYYKHMDRNKIQFDFICDNDSTNIPYDEIKKLGGRVILCPPYQKQKEYQKFLIDLFNKKKYKIVHSNINTLSVFPLHAAYKAGVPIRIAHSHSTSNKKEWKKNIIKNILRPLSKKYANVYFACSKKAGNYLFGKNTNYTIINNAIDLDKFKYNEKIRKEKRKELNIKDSTLVIGHVGRFVDQKNHTFLIDTFNEIHKKNKDTVLLLIGQGPKEKEIKEKVKELKLNDSVKFLGQREDVDKLYNAMDVFLLPSLYEGLGMVLIEAQANGLPCVASTEVPKDADMGNTKFVDLSNKDGFVNAVLDDKLKRKDCMEKIKSDGYDIENEAEKLEKMYEKLSIKNIAMITSGFLPLPATKGGAVENLIMNLVNENEKKQKIKFNIFSIYDEKAVEESKKYKYTEFIFIKTNGFIKVLDKIIFKIAKNILHKKNSQSYRYIMQRLCYLRKVSKYLKQNDYDSVILENHPTQYLALKWNKNYIKYKGRYYYHCHNEFPSTYGCDDIIKKTNKFICVSNYIGNYIKEKVNVDEDHIYVLRNAIDKSKICKKITQEEKTKLKEKLNINPTDKVIIFTGRIVPEKGVLELVEAFNKIKKKNIKLLILGSPLNNLNAITEYQKKVNEICNHNSNIIFTGFVNYDEIYKYYNIADMSVLPSIWNDPAPLTIIESLCSGLPIITTYSGGIPEYTNNKCAILLKRDSKLVDNITNAIDLLVNNQEKLKEMSKESYRFSKKLTVNEYYKDFYKNVGERNE